MSINILIADPHYLIREGLKSIFSKSEGLAMTGEAENREELIVEIQKLHPDVVIIDCNIAGFFSRNDLPLIKQLSPQTNLMVITTNQNKETVLQTLDLGVNSYILKECPKEEIIDGVYAAAKGEKFLCKKVLHTILDKEPDNCDGVKLSDREKEIIRLISEGLTNNQIADKLFLSAHTIATHRKNIMSKLSINKTAGLVVYAVKENIISPNKYLFSTPN